MFSFYSRFIKRQWRLGAIRLFCMAVAIACAVTFSITLLGDRLEQLFINQSKEVLAADLVLDSTTELQPEQFEIIQQTSLAQAITLRFPTMASANDAFMLSSIKAVTDKYPLRGELQVSNTLYGDAVPMPHGPVAGEVWVEDRILNELGLSLGEYVTVGERAFKITRVVIYEPDRGNNFYSFTPRILMHWNDVASTQVIQPGSRLRYHYLFAGEQQVLTELKQNLEPTLQPNQKFETIEDTNEAMANTLQRAYRFLHVTALIAILLGAVGAALVSYQYANEMTYQYAVLRCLGLHGRRLHGAILFPFLVYSLIAIVIGLFLGGIAHYFILKSLGDLIPANLPPPSIEPFLLSSITALIVVISFAWPFLNNLLKTPPKLLLNRIEAQKQPIIFTATAMAIGLAILVYVGTQEILISFYIIAALCVFILLAYCLTQLFISLIIKRSQTQTVSTRLAARMLGANRRMVSLQIIAIAITFFSLALIQTLRDDLVSSWQSKVPENAPNFFAINLFAADKSAFLAELQQKNISHSPLYPVIRGRLSAINNEPIREYASKEKVRDESLNRDLALTWSLKLPPDNKIVTGQWHDPEHPPEQATVSVEEGVAENLKINLGDALEFTIGTHKMEAMVTSLRSVEWESFTPNFYMIFYPGALDGLPVTYLASMHLKQSQRTLLPTFIQHFPSTTFFDVDFLLTRIRGIMQQISTAVEIILYFSLFASLIVFIAIEMILRHYRSYSTAIYKAIGARSELIQKVFRSQFIFIGLIAGAIAYLLNLSIGFIISTYLIKGDYAFNIKTAVLCLLIVPLLVLASGYFSIQRTRQTPAKQLLTEE
jgi:putative ABC transport system permease protein